MDCRQSGRALVADNLFDVIVVGGGHAACEAALASARTGASTLLLAINLDHIAQMSCNPAIGGIAKGHVAREVDSMGGAMGRVTDAAALQFRMLNMAKGPAVWSPRSQCDKLCYQRAMKRELELASNLTLRQALVASFIISGNAVSGVETSIGEKFLAKSVVVATGTFLSGKLHFGLKSIPGGRAGDPPSTELAADLRSQLGLRMGRLKTGTPPRVLASSVDFSQMQPQGPDAMEEQFSFFTSSKAMPEVSRRDMPCYLVYSNDNTAKIVRDNLDKAPMYSGIIEGVGTRYCPSFEDKVVRFPHHERHLLYLEPEGEHTQEYYVNGISTSLPPEVQVRMLRTLPGMSGVSFTRYAYAIEYDFVFPEEIDRSLSVKRWRGLYLAGQINGTSGYEEAAGQGLLAGLNASRHAAGLAHVEIGRDEAYIGVMIDDLSTKEIVEPYRLFTSRAEHRLMLRQDNADMRLCERAHNLGLLPDNDYAEFKGYLDACERAKALCKASKLDGRTLWDALKDLKGCLNAASTPFDASLAGLDTSLRRDRRAFRQIAIEAHYEGYLKREAASIAKLRSLEEWGIPESLDYDSIPGLRNESRAKLKKVKPSSLAQAGRIDGVTPPELALLQIHITKAKRSRIKELEGVAR